MMAQRKRSRGKKSSSMKLKVLSCYETVSFLVNESLLLDAGGVTTMLNIEEQDRIKDILLTHSHLDHIGDIPILIDNTMEGRSAAISIIGTEEALIQVKSHFFNDTIWPDLTKITSEEFSFLNFKPISAGEKFLVDNLTVKAVKVNHIVETMAYIIDDGNTSIIYIGDTGPTEGIWEEANNLSNLKAIFIETTLPNRLSGFACTSGHLVPMSLEEELKKLSHRNISVFLFHLKPRYLDVLKSEIENLRNPNIAILKPGDVLEF